VRKELEDHLEVQLESLELAIERLGRLGFDSDFGCAVVVVEFGNSEELNND
jgi:hypothetical protein